MWLLAPRDRHVRSVGTLRLATVGAGWCLVLTACAAQVPAAVVVDGVDAASAASTTDTAQSDPTGVSSEAAPPASDPSSPTVTSATPSPPSTTTAPSTAAVVEPTTTTVADNEPTTTTSTSAPTTTTAAPRAEAFGDGTHGVGSDVAPGRYELIAPGTGCAWQRLAGLSGEYRDLLASGNPTHHTVVDIREGDAAFTSSDCGAWTEYRPLDEPSEAFGSGTWVVGGHIVAGTYTAAGGEGCFWAKLTSFDGDQTSIASIARPGPGSLTITIEPTDVGFVSDYCGDFALSGAATP